MKIGNEAWVFKYVQGRRDKVLDSGVIIANRYGKFVIRTKNGIVRRKNTNVQ